MYRLNYHPEKEEENLFGLADEAIIFHGLEKCITGMDQFGYAVYDYSKMIDVFTEDGMTHEEAEEWIDFNVACVNAGKGFVIHYPNP